MSKASTNHHFRFDLPEKNGKLTDVKIQNGNKCWLVSGLRTGRYNRFLTLILFKDNGLKIEASTLHTDLVVKDHYEVCMDPKMSLILCWSFSPVNQAVVAYRKSSRFIYKKSCLSSHPVTGMAIGPDLTIALSYKKYVSFWELENGRYKEQRLHISGGSSDPDGFCSALSASVERPNPFYLLTWCGETFSIQSPLLGREPELPQWKTCWKGYVGDIRGLLNRYSLHVSPNGMFALVQLNDYAYLTDMRGIAQTWKDVKKCGFLTDRTLFIQKINQILTFDVLTKNTRDYSRKLILSDRISPEGQSGLSLSRFGISTLSLETDRGFIQHEGFGGFSSISSIDPDIKEIKETEVKLNMSMLIERNKPKAKAQKTAAFLLGEAEETRLGKRETNTATVEPNTLNDGSTVPGSTVPGSTVPGSTVKSANVTLPITDHLENLAFQLEQSLNLWLSATQEVRPELAVLTGSVLYDKERLTIVLHRGRKIVKQIEINIKDDEGGE